MKKLNYLLGLIILIAVYSCASDVKEMPKEAPVPAEQKMAIAHKARSENPANVGKRTAEEMVAAGFKRYGIEKGILIFRMDGALTGTENVYFDHWGWREGKYVQTQADIGTYDKKTNKIQFLDGERRYEYNPNTGEAHFFASRQVQASANRYGTKDMTLVGDEMIKGMGGVIKGTNEIMGVTCQVWQIDAYKTELSMWKGLTMGERSHPENIPVARTCILLDTTSAVPLNKMILPEQATLIDVN